MTTTTTLPAPVEQLTEKIEAGELGPFNPDYTLADMIRMGSTVTEQANGWGHGGEACALSAAYLAARAFGVVDA